MNFYNRIQKEIDKFPVDKLKEYVDNLAARKDKLKVSLQKSAFWLCGVALVYYLIKTSAIKTIPIGPLKIDDLELVLKFIPLLLAYYLYIIASKLSAALKTGYAHTYALKKYYGLHEKSLMLGIITEQFIDSSNDEYAAKKKSSGCTSCFLVLPSLVLLGCLIAILPFIYYLSIKSLFEWYELKGGDLLYWVLTILTGLLLIVSIQTWLLGLKKYIKFLYLKNLEEEKSKK